MPIKITNLTGRTINKKAIASFLANEGTQRDNLQNLIVASAEHASMNNNAFDYLNMLVNGLKERRSRNLEAITTYIGEHITGIKWQKFKGKDSGYGYKAIGDVEYKPFEKSWYEHGKNVQKVATLRLDNRVASMIRDLKAALSGEKKLDGNEQQARSLLQKLEEFAA